MRLYLSRRSVLAGAATSLLVTQSEATPYFFNGTFSIFTASTALAEHISSYNVRVSDVEWAITRILHFLFYPVPVSAWKAGESPSTIQKIEMIPETNILVSRPGEPAKVVSGKGVKAEVFKLRTLPFMLERLQNESYFIMQHDRFAVAAGLLWFDIKPKAPAGDLAAAVLTTINHGDFL